MLNSQIQLQTRSDGSLVVNGCTLLTTRRCLALEMLETYNPSRMQRRLATAVAMADDEMKPRLEEIFEGLNIFLDHWAWDDGDKLVQFNAKEAAQ